jgi:hypothetical protein
MSKEDVGMTMAVTSTEDAGMTVAVMCEAGVCISLMAIANEFMSRRRFTMNRLHHRGSVSFYHFNYSLRVCLNVVRHMWQLC